jgi:hypothetical protein
MNAPDRLVVIPAPTESDKPFNVDDSLTIYEAAMVYAGRHPYPYFFSIKDGSVEEHVEFLRLGVSQNLSRKRLRARRSWDIYCEITKRIEEGVIEPLIRAYDQNGRLDPRRTRIRTAELVMLATERKEQPRSLRPLLANTAVTEQTVTRKVSVSTPVKHYAREIDAEYEQRVHVFFKEHERYPTRAEDMEWGRQKLKRDTLRDLRRKFIPAAIRKGGRPKR